MQPLKTIIFHFLLSFRGLIRFISKLLSATFILTFLSMMFLKEFNDVGTIVKAITFLLAIIFTGIYWLYDYLIYYFQPKNLNVLLRN